MKKKKGIKKQAACRVCGDSADNGEGWDGMCGNCADRAEILKPLQEDVDDCVSEYVYNEGLGKKDEIALALALRTVVSASFNIDFRRGLFRILEELA